MGMSDQPQELSDADLDQALKAFGLTEEEILEAGDEATDEPGDEQQRTNKGTFAKGNTLGTKGRQAAAKKQQEENQKLPTFRSTLKQMISATRTRDRFDVNRASRRIVKSLYNKAEEGNLRAIELILRYLDDEAKATDGAATIVVVSGVPEVIVDGTAKRSPTIDDSKPRLHSNKADQLGPVDFAALDKLKQDPGAPPRTDEVVLTGTSLRKINEPAEEQVFTFNEIMGIDKAKAAKAKAEREGRA